MPTSLQTHIAEMDSFLRQKLPPTPPSTSHVSALFDRIMYASALSCLTSSRLRSPALCYRRKKHLEQKLKHFGYSYLPYSNDPAVHYTQRDPQMAMWYLITVPPLPSHHPEHQIGLVNRALFAADPHQHFMAICRQQTGPQPPNASFKAAMLLGLFDFILMHTARSILDMKTYDNGVQGLCYAVRDRLQAILCQQACPQYRAPSVHTLRNPINANWRALLKTSGPA